VVGSRGGSSGAQGFVQDAPADARWVQHVTSSCSVSFDSLMEVEGADKCRLLGDDSPD
jgi:hypothetical protein